MVTKSYNSLGLKWLISVPATLAEAVLAAGSEEAVLKDHVDHVIFHSTLGGVREDFVAAVATATGIARKTKVVGKKKESDEDIVEFAESELEYFERVLAETGRTAESFADLQQAVLEKNPYDPKPRERKPAAPRSPTKGDYARADAVIASPKKADIIAMLATTLGKEVLDNRDSIARALMEDRIAETEKLAAAQAAKLGL